MSLGDSNTGRFMNAIGNLVAKTGAAVIDGGFVGSLDAVSLD